MTELELDLKSMPIFKHAGKENLIETLFSFYKFLMPEEKRILSILFKAQSPLSIRQIRKQFAVQIAKKYLSYVEKIPFVAKKLEKREWQIKENRVYKPELKNMLENFTDAEITKLIGYLNKISPEKIPSYYKISSILKTFEDQRLVARRELIGTRAENVFCLSPAFIRVLSYAINAIQAKEDPSIIEKELLAMISP
jgi:hypothetical protein